jgi:hypothetical protein
MESQSTFGGTKNLSVTNIRAFKFLPDNCGCHIANSSSFAKGNWVFFVASGNKE